jgi:hypothetical protein
MSLVVGTLTCTPPIAVAGDDVIWRESLPAREISRYGVLPSGWTEIQVRLAHNLWSTGGGLAASINTGMGRQALRVETAAWWSEDGTRASATIGADRTIGQAAAPARSAWWGASASTELGPWVVGPGAELHVGARSRTGPVAWWSDTSVGRYVGDVSAASAPSRHELGARLRGGLLVQAGIVHVSATTTWWWDVHEPSPARAHVAGALTVQLSRGLDVRGGAGWGRSGGLDGPALGGVWWSLEIVVRGG